MYTNGRDGKNKYPVHLSTSVSVYIIAAHQVDRERWWTGEAHRHNLTWLLWGPSRGGVRPYILYRNVGTLVLIDAVRMLFALFSHHQSFTEMNHSCLGTYFYYYLVMMLNT